jgi:phosphatidate cytidylyltransferase
LSNPVQSTIEKAPQAIRNTIEAVPGVVDQATPHFPEAVGYAFLGAYLILMAATAIVWVRKTLKPEREYAELKLRIKTWWVIVVLATLALGFNQYFSIFCIGFLSFVAFKEYLSVIPTRRADHRVLLWAYLAIPIQYILVGVGWYGVFIIFIPVYWFLIMPMRMVLIGETRGFLRAAGSLQWGLMTCVFSLSHMAYLLVLPQAGNPNGGGVGLLFYLVFLTQFNDVAQYVWGKRFGRTQVAPTISPDKTMEGLVGGVMVTTLLALALAPWLTPMGHVQALAAGLLIGFGGFIGDVTISAIKRDLGLKESGSLLPGHGGILDRIDSLTFTSPVFFHFVYYLYY